MFERNYNFTQAEMVQHINTTSMSLKMYIVENIDVQHLPAMLDDGDVNVRRVIADRIDESFLPRLMYDCDVNVRLRVARRIDRENALLMSGIDKNKIIRHVALKNALGLWVNR
jgi:hypothetical protein